MFAYAERKQTSKDTFQKKEFVKIPAYLNQTGIPDNMKAGFENLSGFSFDDVRVHYSSDKPARLQALAYTQGNQVYIGPGQEKHLGHELGHVVQQKQGIVKPVSYIGSVPVNNDPVLEKNADKIFEEVNKAHKATAQLKRDAGKRQPVSSTVQLTGGRDEDWSKLSYQKINSTYQILAHKLADHYNTELEGIIARLNEAKFRKKNPILPADHKLLISGSTLVMKIRPDQFVADDIDLDYYNYKSANEVDSIYDPSDSIVWTNLISKFSHDPFQLVEDDFVAEKTDYGESDTGIEKREFKITFKDDPTVYYINVEIKNITTKIWHEGWKAAAKRDVMDTMETSEKQLYMDTCLRINDIISAVLTEQSEINENTPESELNLIRQQIKDSVDAKQYILKKKILEENLFDKDKYQETIDMAQAKLEENTYKRWLLISQHADISLDLLHQYLKLAEGE